MEPLLIMLHFFSQQEIRRKENVAPYKEHCLHSLGNKHSRQKFLVGVFWFLSLLASYTDKTYVELHSKKYCQILFSVFHYYPVPLES